MKLLLLIVMLNLSSIDGFIRTEIGALKEYSNVIDFYENVNVQLVMSEFMENVPPELLEIPSLLGPQLFHSNNFQLLSNTIHKAFRSFNYTTTPINSTLNCDLHCEIEKLEQYLLSFIKTLDLSTGCKNDSEYLLRSISSSMYQTVDSNTIEWSWQLLDAMGKPGPGILNGNLWWKGNEFQCLNLKAPRPDFHGKYCYALLKLPLALGCQNVPGAWCLPGLLPWKCPRKIDDILNAFIPVIRLALCIPSRCSEQDATLLLDTSTFLGSDATCGAICFDHYVPWTAGPILMGIFFTVITIFCVSGSFYDYVFFTPAIRKIETNFANDALVIRRALYTRTRGYLLRSMLAFSFYSNGKQILATEVKPGQIIALHGIRVCSLLWVMLAHSYQAVLATDNVVEPLRALPKQLLNLTLTNATFSVDTFFLLSGLLLSYLWNKEIQKNAKRLSSFYSWVIYYVHRYIRLTPVYAIVLASYIFLTPHLVKGAIHQMPDAENCADHWWSNLLYFNNVYKPNQLCYSISWYLGNDMQFYCLAPLVLVPMFYYPISTIVVWTLLMLCSLAGNAYTVYHYHVSPNVIGAPMDPVYLNMSISEGWTASGESISWDLLYCAPWIRFPPYVIGMFLGYFFANKESVKLNKYFSGCIWCIAWLSALSIVYCLYDNERGAQLDLATRVFYLTISRPLWAICVSWVIFACHYGYGGWINEFLSYKGFIPLARISFCAYLCHITVEYVITLNWGKASSWNGHFNWVTERTLPLALSAFASAFVLAMALEKPVLALEKLVFPGRRTDHIKNAIIPEYERKITLSM